MSITLLLQVRRSHYNNNAGTVVNAEQSRGQAVGCAWLRDGNHVVVLSAGTKGICAVTEWRGAHKAGNMTRILHRSHTYVWMLIIALVVAGAVVVARTLGAFDSYDGI